MIGGIVGYTRFAMDELKLEKLRAIFRKYPTVKLAYLFGSAASGQMGPLSDFDFAVFFDPFEKVGSFRRSLSFSSELSSELSTDAIDIVILNNAESTELKYEIIANGKLIYEIEPYRLVVEPLILNEYFDFRSMLIRHELTQVFQ